jgi:hypothetical protein
MNNITIQLSVDDTAKLLRMVNASSLTSFSQATTICHGSASQFDVLMRDYEDKQRILDLITAQAHEALGTEEEHPDCSGNAWTLTIPAGDKRIIVDESVLTR